jgi:hypothetical protein
LGRIVNGKTGLPGTGFIAAENVPKAQLETFEEDCTKHRAPSAEEFAEAYKKASSVRLGFCSWVY